MERSHDNDIAQELKHYTLIRFLIIFLPLSLLIGIIVWIFYNSQIKASWKIVQADENLAVRLVINDINAELSVVSSDLLYLTREKALNDWFENDNNDTTANIATDYYAFSESKVRYDQIRLIDNRGYEVVRVNWNNGEPVIVPSQELQDKSDRYYVREAQALTQGQITMSPFDLNVEHGEIEQPLKPIIRFSTPVFDQQGNRRGVIVLNYLGERLIDRIKTISLQAATVGHLWLVNNDGYWLIGPRPEDEWAFMYPGKTERRFGQEHTDVWHSIVNGARQGQLMEKNEGLYSYSSIRLKEMLSNANINDMPEQKQWHVVSFFPNAIFSSRTADLKHNLLYVYIVLMLILSAIALITARNSTKRKQSELIIRVNEARFRGLLEAAPDAVVIVDEGGHIVLINAQTEKLFGYKRDELIGQRIEFLVPERYRKQHDGYRQGYIANPRLRPMGEGLALTGLCKDGTEVPVSISLSPMHSEQGTLVFCDIRDVTSQRKAEQRIKELNETLKNHNAELKVVNQELEAFSYSVSHDLRSPLRAIDGFSRILIDDFGERLDEAGRDRLHRVRSAAQHMGTLIDDLLKLSRVTRLELKYTEVDMSTMAREISSNLQESEPQRNVRFRIKDGLMVRGDPQLIRIALDNLIGNAWKFTSQIAKAVIEFDEIRQDKVPTYYIRDNGAGFDMSYVNKLFGAFQRLHDKKEFPGTGIGLATVKRVINKHGGQVRAESAVNQGATFYFTLG